MLADITFCKVAQTFVQTDQTFHECACEHECPVDVCCPLEDCFVEEIFVTFKTEKD